MENGRKPSRRKQVRHKTQLLGRRLPRLHRLQIAGVRVATAATPAPVFVPCTASDFTNFRTVSIDDVVHAIRMSPVKQCSSNQLPTWLQKECAATLAPYITHLFNLSLVEGHFPSHWKHAIVTPHLKKTGLDVISLESPAPVQDSGEDHQLSADQPPGRTQVTDGNPVSLLSWTFCRDGIP